MLWRCVVTVSVAGMVACAAGEEWEELEGVPEAPDLEMREDHAVHNQGYQLQGYQLQGYQLQGTSMTGADIKGFRTNVRHPIYGSTVDVVEVVKGGLVLKRSTQTWPIIRGGGRPAVYEPCVGTPEGGLRNCGWDPAGIGKCTPGVKVTLSTQYATCQDACTGSPLLRVCAGSGPCTNASRLGIAGSSPGCSACPKLTFVCPSSGKFAVMTAPNRVSEPDYKVKLLAENAIYPFYNAVAKNTQLAQHTVYAELTDAGVIPMRIESVAPKHFKSSDTFLFRVSYDLPDGGQGDLCEGASGGTSTAIPITGYYNKDAGHVNDPSFFTLACPAGVAAKCYNWGYKPWQKVDGGVYAKQTPQQLHTACTRMARADYCGDGRSFTKENTPIDMYDRVTIQHRAGDAGMTFEAAWTEHGAVCLSHRRWSDAPLNVMECERLWRGYEGKDAGPTCELIEGRDPRPGDDAGAESPSYFNKGVLLFNDSHFNDAGTP